LRLALRSVIFVPMEDDANADSTAAARPALAHLGIALALAAIVHLRALGTFFAQDDIAFLSRAAGLTHPDHLYRPLSEVLAFRLMYAWFGLNPLGYHAVNLGLHLFCVAGVYALGTRLTGRRVTGFAAAVLFGCSPIAFTPLHWATGIIDLLACALLIAATLLHLRSREHGGTWAWLGALVALMAMLAKETAVAWIALVAACEWPSDPERKWGRRMIPAATVTLSFAALLVGSGHVMKLDASAAYATTLSPAFIIRNLLTYVRWCTAFWEPIPDRLAAVDPGAWRLGLPVVAAVAAVMFLKRRTSGAPAMFIGLAWWLGFLAPVLPLLHHTYLYYAYIPWAGGAIGTAALGRALSGGSARSVGTLAGMTALGLFVALSALAMQHRASMIQNALPVDRTIRDAVLLRHSLEGLRAANLQPGTRVAFLNPVPGPHFDLAAGGPASGSGVTRTSYYPLEAAMRGGETLRLFFPRLIYLGFARVLPPAWEDSESFYFEQRGWLEPWGHGQRALLRQAETQAAAADWAGARESYGRARALGDSIPAALLGEIVALDRLGRDAEARGVAQQFVSRWPDDPRAAALPIDHGATP
jgi:hypothetical protein